jgi:hypothetical protein
MGFRGAEVSGTLWNEWYNTKHIPTRIPVPGFLFARRFVAVESKPKYLALYDLADTSVISSEAYMKLRDMERALPPDSFEHITSSLPNLMRGIYDQIFPEHSAYEPPTTDFVFMLGHNVPAGKDDVFNAWYKTAHIPAMRRVPGFVAARRFRANDAKFPDLHKP